jgi:PEGA domain
MMAKWLGWRKAFAAIAGVVVFAAIAPGVRAESFKITSTPAGASVEIDGAVVGTTPFEADYPGGYFHKTHTVFSARLEHRMVLKVSKDGYALQQITLTDGPFDWIGVTGKHHGKYFLLRSDHYELKLEPVAVARETSVGRVGPIHPHGTELREAGATGETGSVAIASDPVGAEIYVDGKFVGQTPSTIPLPAGTHHVEVKASGRMHWERDLTVVKESEVSLKAILERP